MAWTDTLLDASFRGVVFDVQRTDDNADRALSEHAYPYIDGADIEDMGRGAHRLSVDAIFYGDDYETRLQEFLKFLDQAGSGELIHPVFGSFKYMQVMRYAVRHEADNVDQASVNIEFEESTPSNPFFDRSIPMQQADAIGQHGDIAVSASNDAAANVVEKLRTAFPYSALDKIRTAMTGPLLAAEAQAQSVLTSGLDVLAYPRAWGNDISALVGGILDAQDYTTNLMANWQTVKSNLTLFDVFSSQSSTPPAQISTSQTPTEDQAVSSAEVNVKVNAAVGLAEATGQVLISEAQTPTLSPVDIETIANAARTNIEDAITDVRAVYPIETSRPITEALKDQALAIQEAAQAIIEARPPLIPVTITAPGNLRLIAHRLYGDHTRAPELYRLNNLRLPNFIQAGDVINAYSS